MVTAAVVRAPEGGVFEEVGEQPGKTSKPVRNKNQQTNRISFSDACANDSIRGKARKLALAKPIFPEYRNYQATARFRLEEIAMKFLLLLIGWCLLLAVSWPLALLVLVLAPLVWLVSLPFRLLGICIAAVFALVRALLFLPARLLGYRPRAC